MGISLERQAEYLPSSMTGLQIGRDTLRAFGRNPDEPVVVTTHFLTPPDGEFTEPVPQDIALESSMTYTCTKPGEYGLGPVILPWFKEYAVRTGIHAQGAHYIEIPYSVNGEIKYPIPDPQWQALQQGIPLPQGAHYITPFPHEEAKLMCAQSGLNPVQTFSPVEVGDKHAMREFFEENGYPNIPFHLMRGEEDIESAIALLREHSSPIAWVKLMRSSGGAGVTPIYLNGIRNDELTH